MSPSSLGSFHSPPSAFTFVQSNCRSLKTKIDYYSDLLRNSNISLLSCCETWLTDDIPDSFLTRNQFNVVRRDRGSHGGGLCLFLAPYVHFTQIDLSSSSHEIIAIDILAPIELRFISIYNPNHNSSLNPFLKLLSSLILSSPFPCIIAGDFNLRHIDWPTKSTIPNCTQCFSLIHFAATHGLSQLVDFPTRNNNVLDLIFCSAPDTPYSVHKLPSISDHVNLLCSLTVPPSSTLPSSSPSNCFAFRKANYDLINIYLASLDWYSLLCVGDSIQNMYDRFVNALHSAISSFVPVADSTFTPISPLLSRLLARQDLYLRTNHPHYTKLSKLVARQYKREALRRENRKVLRSSNGLFNHLRSVTKSKSVISALICPDGSIATSPIDKANTLRAEYSSVFISDDDNLPPFPRRTSHILDPPDLSPHVIERCLFRLAPKFSPGPENIPSFFLKKCCTSLALPLSLIFSSSLSSGQLPSQWKLGSISPLLKKNSRRDSPSSYRPISMLSNICKCFERILKAHISAHLVSHNLLTDAQFGFRHGRSTSTQLLAYISYILSRPPTHFTDVCYIDFARAFDTVSHPKLIHKLVSYGIRGPLLSWIANWLSNRTQTVRVDSAHSVPFTVTSGVPQGSCLGPLLFLLYINDIIDVLSDDCIGFLFADDLKIVSSRPKNSPISHLQTAIDSLSVWCNHWQMTINSSKTVILHPGRTNPCLTYTYINSALTSCKSVRDLGVLLAHDLSFRDHIVHITTKATKCINFLFIALKTKSSDVLIHAYKSYCLPILDYCCPVYFPPQQYLVQMIERVQSYFLRRLQYRCNITLNSYAAACIHFDLVPLTTRRSILSLSLAHSLFSISSSVSPSSLFAFRASPTRGLPYKLSPLYKSHSNAAKSFFPHRLANSLNKLSPDFFSCKRCQVRLFLSSSDHYYCL